MTLFTTRSIPCAIAACAFTLMVGCGGTDTSQENASNAQPPQSDDDQALVYNGPLPATDDVGLFRELVWPVLAVDDSCGGCHNEVEGQEPLFMRHDDINLAYEATLPLVNKEAPVLSRLVERAEAGHPDSSNPALADTITNLIQRWATASGAVQTEVILTAPAVRTVSGSRQFLEGDAAVQAYADTIGALVRNASEANCLSCHAEDTQVRQQPFFASANPSSGFFAARSLIDTGNASISRFVDRMREGHNAWADPDGVLSNQVYSTQEMLAAVQAFIDAGTEEVEVDESLLASNAMALFYDDIVIASSGGRVDTDAIALYQFKQGQGSIAYDTSAVSPPLNLNLSPGVEWVGSWGIRIEDNGKAQGDTVSSQKINDLIRLTGEYSVEAWVIPGNVVQEESRIVTYSGGTNERNFSLHQNIYDYDFLTRTENSDANGMPLLNTPSADEVLQATLQHVIATYDPIEGRRLYVNGELIISDPIDGDDVGGNINDWDDSFVLAVGNEVDNAQWWEGTMRFLAIHNRVLSEDQVLANFDAGVGQKYYMLFGVSHLVSMPDAYVVFQVEAYDDYSYLFSSPFFISLDDGAVPTTDIDIRGIRIGINGKEAQLSQGFANADVTVSASNYDAESGVPLVTNPVGTLIASQNGPTEDVFFLTFDHIGGVDYVRAAAGVPAAEEEPLSTELQPDIGVRMFDEVFNNMSAITTVPSARIVDYYETEVRRSLPGASLAAGFLASQQAAITQLALAYCTELINDGALNTAMFGNYGTLSSDAERDALIDPLLARMLITDDGRFTEHPSAIDIKSRLIGAASEGGLLENMTTNDVTVKATAVCTSVLSSAAMLMQ